MQSRSAPAVAFGAACGLPAPSFPSARERLRTLDVGDRGRSRRLWTLTGAEIRTPPVGRSEERRVGKECPV